MAARRRHEDIILRVCVAARLALFQIPGGRGVINNMSDCNMSTLLGHPVLFQCVINDYREKFVDHRGQVKKEGFFGQFCGIINHDLHETYSLSASG